MNYTYCLVFSKQERCSLPSNYRNYNYLEDATEKDVETQYAFRLWMPYFFKFRNKYMSLVMPYPPLTTQCIGDY